MADLHQKESNHKAPETPSLLERVGFLGIMKIGVGIFVFLVMILFYTMLPIAGLQLLPFLFFGCICLMVGIGEDIGLYR